MSFESLPNDVLLEFFLNMSLDQINSYCRVNWKLNLLCNNDTFWKIKYERDYGIVNYPVANWKEKYLNYGKLLLYDSDVNNSISKKIFAKKMSTIYPYAFIIDRNNIIHSIKP